MTLNNAITQLKLPLSTAGVFRHATGFRKDKDYMLSADDCTGALLCWNLDIPFPFYAETLYLACRFSLPRILSGITDWKTSTSPCQSGVQAVDGTLKTTRNSSWVVTGMLGSSNCRHIVEVSVPCVKQACDVLP